MSTMRSPNVVADFDASVAAAHLLDACGGNPKKVALAAGRSPRTGRRYANGDQSSPVNHMTRILKRAANPWRLVAYFVALALRREVGDDGFLAEWAWRQEIRAALCDQQGPDGDEDTVSQLFLVGEATPMDLFNAFSRFLSTAFRVTALALYGGMMGYTLRDGDDR